LQLNKRNLEIVLIKIAFTSINAIKDDLTPEKSQRLTVLLEAIGFISDVFELDDFQEVKNIISDNLKAYSVIDDIVKKNK